MVPPVWWFPPTYVLHLLEEYFIAGGFPEWVERTFAIRFSSAEFLAWNALGFASMCVGAWLAGRYPRLRFIEIAIAVAVLGNVLGHVLASVALWTYSPGLITSVLVWTPLAIIRIRHAREACTRRARTAGVSLGVGVVLVTVAIVVSGAL